MGSAASSLLTECVGTGRINHAVLKAVGGKSEEQAKAMQEKFTAMRCMPGLELQRFASLCLMSVAAAGPAFRVLSSSQQNNMVDAHEVTFGKFPIAML
jgi:hypothetical protein